MIKALKQIIKGVFLYLYRRPLAILTLFLTLFFWTVKRGRVGLILLMILSGLFLLFIFSITKKHCCV